VAQVTTLVITISGDTPLVMDGSEAGASALGVTAYTEPAVQPRVSYAPTSPYLHGEAPLGWSYQQTLLSFSVAPIAPASEAAARALIETLRAAVTRMSFTVTVNVNGAGNEVWACHVGSVTPAGGRDSVNLRDHNPEWNVSIPCYPVRVS
jgi:hypothetical protein